jgi:hypothetical protein
MPVIALVLVLSAAFGAGDQYLGSLTGSGHLWAAGWSSGLSLLSAPWLVLPFVAGVTQRDPWRAALLGLACTYAALLGYGLMTISRSSTRTSPLRPYAASSTASARCSSAAS